MKRRIGLLLIFFATFAASCNSVRKTEVSPGIFFYDVGLSSIDINSDDTKMLGVQYSAAATQSSISILDLETLEINQVPSGHGLDRYPSWYPGEPNKILLHSQTMFTPGGIGTYSVDSGQFTRISKGSRPDLFPDGKRIAYRSFSTVIISENKREIDQVSMPNGELIDEIEVSPSSNSIAISANHRVYIYKLDTQELQLLFEDSLENYLEWSPDEKWIIVNYRWDTNQHKIIGINIETQCVSPNLELAIPNLDLSHFRSELIFGNNYVYVTGEWKGHFGILQFEKDVFPLEKWLHCDS